MVLSLKTINALIVESLITLVDLLKTPLPVAVCGPTSGQCNTRSVAAILWVNLHISIMVYVFFVLS